MVAGRLQEKKGYFYIVLSFKDETNKHKTKWISTGLPVKGNKKKAEDILLEARKSFQVAIVPKENVLFFTDFLKDWLKMVKPNIELTTYGSYSICLNSVVCPYFDEKGLPLNEVQPRHIQDFYTYLMADRGVKANTVIHYHAVIRKALKYAVDTDVLVTNPADRIQRPKVPKYVGQFYDIDEVNSLFDVAKGSRIELPIKLAAFYGLRRSEIIGLKWDAIDFKNKTISIRHTVTSTRIDGKHVIIEKDRTKNRSSYRSLPLVDDFYDFLAALKAQQAENRALCKGSYNKEFLDYICVDDLGNRVKPDFVTQHFKLILNNKGLRQIRFHDLRHTCASLLLSNGVSMKEIQEWLGHSDYGTTANIYGHLDVNAKVRSAETMRATGMRITA